MDNKRKKIKKEYKIGIAGVGIVGGSLKKYFEKKGYKLFLYDKKAVGSIEELNKADYIYICLPTPYRVPAGCDIKPIEELVGRLSGKKNIIIKVKAPAKPNSSPIMAKIESPTGSGR